MIKLERGQKYADLSVEYIIDCFKPEHLKNMDHFLSRLRKEDFDPEEYEVLLRKLEYARKRITEPLEFSLRLMYFLIPFGKTSDFTPNETRDIKRFRKLRYLRKTREYIIFSILGILGYIAVTIILIKYL